MLVNDLCRSDPFQAYNKVTPISGIEKAIIFSHIGRVIEDTIGPVVEGAIGPFIDSSEECLLTAGYVINNKSKFKRL